MFFDIHKHYTKETLVRSDRTTFIDVEQGSKIPGTRSLTLLLTVAIGYPMKKLSHLSEKRCPFKRTIKEKMF